MLHWLQQSLGVDRQVLALSLARLGDAIGNSILIVVIPLYVARLPSPLLPFHDALLVGILISLYGFANTAAQPVAGMLIDRWGHRKAFIQGGLLLMGVSTVALTFAGRYFHLVLLRSLQGVGFAMTLPASLAILKGATESHHRGSAMGFFATCRMIGFSVGPLLGGLLQVRYGFAAAFVTGASFIGLAMVCVQLWVRDEGGVEVPAAPIEAVTGGIVTRELLTLGTATMVMAMTISMMTAVENEMNHRLQQTALGFGIAFSALTVTRILFQVPLGKLSDRIGRRPLIVAGLVVLAPATVLIGITQTTLQLTGARLLQGIASAAIASPAFALAADVSTEGGEGRQLSILTMGFGLGIATGPLLAGALAGWSYELPFLIGGGLALLSAAATVRFVRNA